MKLIKAGGQSNASVGKRRGRPQKRGNDGTAVLTTRVSKELHATMKAFAIENGTSSSQLMSELLEADLRRYLSIRDFAKKNNLSVKNIVTDLLEADIKKMKAKSVTRMFFVSIFSKVPYVVIGVLAGLGFAMIVKDAFLPLFLEKWLPYIETFLN